MAEILSEGIVNTTNERSSERIKERSELEFEERVRKINLIL